MESPVAFFVEMARRADWPDRRLFLGLSGLPSEEIEGRLQEVEVAIRGFLAARAPEGPFVLVVDFERSDQLSVAHSQGINSVEATKIGEELSQLSPEEFGILQQEIYSGTAPYGLHG